MESYSKLVERHFMDGRIEVWGLKDSYSEWQLVDTYQAEMPEVKTWQDVIDEQKPSEVAHNFVGL